MQRIALALALVAMTSVACQKAQKSGMAADSARVDSTRMADSMKMMSDTMHHMGDTMKMAADTAKKPIRPTPPRPRPTTTRRRP